MTTTDGGGTVMIWPIDRPDEPVTLQHAGSAWGVVARDGSHIMTTSAEGRVRFWQPDGSLVREFAGPEGQGNGGFGSTADVSQITADFLDGTLRTWSMSDGGEAIVLRHDQPVNAIAFSPDGRHIATGAADGVARIWAADGAGGPILLTGHVAPAEPSTYQPWARSPDGVASVRFSADGSRLITASTDGTVRVRNADGTGEPFVIETGGPVVDADLSADGAHIVAAMRDGRVLQYPADGAGAPAVIARGPARIEGVSFSPDGSRILIASEAAQINDVGGGRVGRLLRGSYFVADAEFSPDGASVVIGSESGDVRVFPV